MGLAIVAHTLDAHGGRHELGRTERGGGRVRLVLPLPLDESATLAKGRGFPYDPAFSIRPCQQRAAPKSSG